MKNIILILTALSIVGCSAVKNTKPTKEELTQNFFDAVIGKDSNLLNELSEAGADVNAYDSSGYTPLMRAIKSHDSNIAEKLIELGAKIYKPRQKNKDLNVISMFNKVELEIDRVINDEIKRYGTELEALIMAGKYGESLILSEENYLPINLKMPQSDKTSLQLIAQTYHKQKNTENIIHLANYIKYILKNIDQDSTYLVDHESSFRLLNKLSNNKALFNEIKRVYIKNKSHISGIKISENDSTDIDWVTLKLNAINESGKNIPLDNFYLDIYLKALKSDSESNSDKWIDLTKEILNSQNNYQSKNKFVQKALVQFLKQPKISNKYLKLSLNLLNIWSSYLLPRSETLFDKNMLMLLTYIEPQNINFKLFEKLTQSLSSYSTKDQNKSKEVIKFILSSNFKVSQRKELIKIVCSVTDEILPRGIISDAIKINGIIAIQNLIDSNVTFKPEEQTDATLSAILNSRSGSAAYSILVLLKEQKIPFPTKSGVQTLKLVLEKVWTGDEEYRMALNLLVSHPSSPILAMSNEGVSNILIKHLEFVKREQHDWELIHKILDSYKNDLFIKHYRQNTSKLGNEKMKISFVWDYILTMYNIYRSNHKTLGSMTSVLYTLLSKIPDDNFSMAAFNEKNESEILDNSFVHQILPLSLILSTDANTIESALLVKNVAPYQINLEPKPPKFSWRAFLSGNFYNHYSVQTDFWETISHVLFKKKQSFHLTNDRSSLDFMKIMIYDKKFHTYPRMAKALMQQRFSLPLNQDHCILNEEEVKSANLPEVIMRYENELTHSEQREWIIPSQNKRGGKSYQVFKFKGSPYWSHIGVFEMLRPLRDRSCSGLPASEQEIQLIKAMVENNKSIIFIKRTLLRNEDVSQIGHNYSAIQSIRNCSSPSEDNQEENFKHSYYSNIGTSLPDVDIETAHDGMHKILVSRSQCNFYSPLDWVKSSVIRSFLSHWYSCTSEARDQKLKNYFHSLETELGIKSQKEPLDENVYSCRWKSQ